ncbi:MAG: hypothetical protein AAFQ88_13065 [Pseudomonadota bacterium]
MSQNVEQTAGAGQRVSDTALSDAIDALGRFLPGGSDALRALAGDAHALTHAVITVVGGEKAMLEGKVPADVAEAAAEVLKQGAGRSAPARCTLAIGALMLAAGEADEAQRWLARASRAARSDPAGRDLLRNAQKLLLRRALG